MTSTQSIKVAVIGVGLIGPRHCRTVVASPDAVLSAIVDPMPHGAKLAKELGTSHYKSIAELLASPDKPDGAIVCTPNHTHVALAMELTDGGVNVLLEKPVATDLESGLKLMEHMKGKDVNILVGHHRRFNPYLVTANEAVKSGSLGRIIAAHGFWTTFKPDDYFDPPTEWRKSETGGVALINLIHDADLLQYLMGPIVRVHAEKTISTRGHAAEEGAAMTFKFESGAVGTFLIGDNLVSPFNFESGTGENPLIPKSGSNFYTIFGANATLTVPDMTRWSYDGTTKTWHEALKRDSLEVPEGVPFEIQLAHFVRMCKGQEPPNCSVKDALSALMVCEAAKKAIRSGETVDVHRLE